MRTLKDLRRVYTESLNAGRSPSESAEEVRRRLVEYFEKPENEGVIRQNVYFSRFSVVECVDLLMVTVWGWVNETDSGHEVPVSQRP